MLTHEAVLSEPDSSDLRRGIFLGAVGAAALALVLLAAAVQSGYVVILDPSVPQWVREWSGPCL